MRPNLLKNRPVKLQIVNRNRLGHVAPTFANVKRKKFALQNLEITGYASEGKALARVDGKVIFVEGAVPGDVVDVWVSKSKKDYAEARVTRLVKPSPERVEPFCSHFGTCGGCKWQMLPYERQLEYKEQEVAQHFRRLGKLDIPAIQPIVGSEKTQQYRNKLEFTFSNKRYLTDAEIAQAGEGNDIPQTPALGFHVPRIFDKVIDIDACYLMDDVNNAIRNFLRSYALNNDLPYYDIKAHTGFLRNVIIRHCTTGDLMVNLVVGEDRQDWLKPLLDELLKAVPQITTLLYTINTKWNDSIYDLEPVTYFGPGYAIEQLGKYRFKVGPKSFFQTNTQQAERLYSITQDFAQLTGKEVVYDLYCGTGSIGIFVSAGAAKVIGVETVAEAIEDAKVNAAMNGLTHTDFYAGDVIKVCDDAFFAQHGKPDVIITDPPRAGMHEKLVQKLLEIEAPRIVYVSCNTATQARDLALLAEKYVITRIQPVDMFPHTHHIECVVALALRDDSVQLRSGDA